MSEERFSKKTILILVIVVASGLGLSTAFLGFMNLVSLNSYNALIEDYDKLSGDYDVLLTNYSGILTSYYNVNEKYQNLTEDYDDLNETYYILTEEHDGLQEDYDELVIYCTKIQDDYNDLFILYGELITDYNNLKEQFDDLQDEYNELQKNNTNLQNQYNTLLNEYQILQIDYDNLNETYYILIGNYTELKEDYNDLVIDYGNLFLDYNDLMLQFNALQQDFNDLQMNYQFLQGQYDDLLNNYNFLSGEYNKLLDDYDVLEGQFINLQIQYNNLEEDYNILLVDYIELLDQYNILNETYYILVGNYTDLKEDYNDLVINYNDLMLQFINLQQDYDELQIQYDALKTYISTLILPAQYMVFAEAVRRYYTLLYLGGTTKEWYMGYAEFCRDIVLHDTEQENSFQDVSNALSECLKYGNDTMYLAFINMWMNFFPWLFNWDGFGLSGVDNLTDINTIHQWCVDEIDYEYDSDIRYGQENPTWDYPKFPVETAFRTMGDCEDQAILDAAYLESCGFETMIAISHDPNHPTIGSFYHGSLLVHIEDIATFWAMYPTCSLWNFGGMDPYYPDYTWCWLDPTWNVTFGSTPTWLQNYIDYGGLTFNIISIAVCDPDGDVGQPELQCSILN